MRHMGWLALGAAGVGTYALLHQRGSAIGVKTRRQPPPEAPRIVVLGGGFAGKAAVKGLAEWLHGRAHILLIDQHNYHLFTPMLYEAATCVVVPFDTAYPLRQWTGRHGVGFRRAQVRGVDFNRRVVILDEGNVAFDYLVLALGSTTTFFNNDSARQHSLPLKQLEDGIAIRNRVLDMLEQASTTADPGRRASMLTFVIVGGGATGVETAGALADLLHRIAPLDYPQLDTRDAHIVIVDSAPKLLGHMSSRMADVALRELRGMGVDVRLNTTAQTVEPGLVRLSDGDTISAQTIVWAAGVEAPDVIAALEVPHGPKGTIAVDEHLQVRERPGVYAVGDNAHIIDSRTLQTVPLLAAAAEQQGRAVARNIARAIAGREQVPFHFVNLGNIVALGHRAGVAQFGGVLIDGIFGFFAWRLVHLVRITSFRNKLVTAVDWTVGYLYDEDTARLEVEPSYPARKAA